MRARVPPPSEALARAAEHLVGAPFRLHGRDPETGLDCVGLLAAALTGAGAAPAIPAGYALRNLSVDRWLSCAPRSGLAPAEGPLARGDALLLRLGRAQHHLAIAADARTIIHADAGLRRVVRQPIDPAWAIEARWRLSSEMLKG